MCALSCACSVHIAVEEMDYFATLWTVKT